MFSLHYLNLDFKVPFFILNDKKMKRYLSIALVTVQHNGAQKLPKN